MRFVVAGVYLLVMLGAGIARNNEVWNAAQACRCGSFELLRLSRPPTVLDSAGQAVSGVGMMISAVGYSSPAVVLGTGFGVLSTITALSDTGRIDEIGNRYVMSLLKWTSIFLVLNTVGLGLHVTFLFTSPWLRQMMSRSQS
jgi:hypothetical protein